MAKSRATGEIGIGALDESVRATARDGEPDRHICALLAPPPARSGLLALAAFASEVTRIGTQVREPMMGEIRLQWWRDALPALARGERTGNPVADALGSAMHRYSLTPEVLERYLEARGDELARDVPPDDDTVETHLIATEGSLFALGLAVMTGARPDRSAEPLVRSAALAYGLARGLGRLPQSLRHGGLVISAARLEQAGLAPVTLAQQPVAEDTAIAIDNVARGLEARGRDALDSARQAFRSLGSPGIAAFLPLAMVEPYFSAQNRPGYRRLETVADVTPLARAWRLWRASRRGRF